MTDSSSRRREFPLHTAGTSSSILQARSSARPLIDLNGPIGLPKNEMALEIISPMEHKPDLVGIVAGIAVDHHPFDPCFRVLKPRGKLRPVCVGDEDRIGKA